MFQFFSEIGFNIVKPAILAYMKKKNYPQDAVVRKNARFEEGFSKDDNVIMFHAVSVGEAVALENLVRRTRKEFPEAKIVVTTGTWTGQDIAKKKMGEVIVLGRGRQLDQQQPQHRPSANATRRLQPARYLHAQRV